VTSVGRWLRRTSIDELPANCVNVLLEIWSMWTKALSFGVMRPAVELACRKERICVKPGPACLGKGFRARSNFVRSMMQLDFLNTIVIAGRSGSTRPILLRTIPAIVLARGASEGVRVFKPGLILVIARNARLILIAA